LSLTLVVFLFREKLSLIKKLVLIWFGFSWFAALLSSRPYPHYLIQLLPALSLSLGFFAYQKKQSSQQILFPLIMLFILQATFLIFNFWTYPNLVYYQNFYQFISGQKSQQEYFYDFDHHAPALYQTALWLNSRTLPNEKIFIWGTEPSLYALSRKLPVGRYAAAYHIVDFDAYQETIKALTKDKPRFLIISDQETHPFPSLKKLVRQHYSLEKKIGGFNIYYRAI